MLCDLHRPESCHIMLMMIWLNYAIGRNNHSGCLCFVAGDFVTYLLHCVVTNERLADISTKFIVFPYRTGMNICEP